MERIFLDWNRPCIPSLVEHLLARCRVGTSDFYDLSGYVLVFPNRAASKRFLTVLADYAWQHQCTIEPPRVKHMGDFMELLYEQKAPCASLLTQQVLWMQALKQVHAANPQLFSVMFPNAPAADDVEAWFLMGAEMTETFQELVRENYDFTEVFRICEKSGKKKEIPESPDVPPTHSENPESVPSAWEAEGLEEALRQDETFFEDDFSAQDPERSSAASETAGADGFSEESASGHLPYREVRRWEFLAQTEAIYYQRLTQLGLWDRQAARLFALRNSEPGTSSTTSKDFQISFRLGVVGCVDLSSLQRKFLERVGSHVEAFVFAPESMKDRFELDGCLKPGCWHQLEPELNAKLHSVLFQATKPEEQVQVVTDWLRKIAPRTPIEDVTLGLADESLEPGLLQALSMARIPNVRAGKKLLADLQPWKLLKRMSEYFQSVTAFRPGRPLVELMEQTGPEYETLALFLRQEDVGNYLRSLKDENGDPLITGDWIAELDRYFNRFYPNRMPAPTAMAFRQNEFPALCRAYRIVHDFLHDYAKEYVTFHSLLSIVTQFLKRIYCWKANYDASDETDYQIIRGCMDLNHLFSDKLQLPQPLLADLVLTLPQALNLLLSQTASKQMVSSALPGTISIQRWLDLPLDDAPAMAVMGANENFIPESISEHIFLPNQLRQKLGVKTNENRFERDIFNLSVILASRKDVCVTLGRISAAGDALFPSRLLLTENSDALIDQVVELFEEPKEEFPAGNSQNPATQTDSDLKPSVPASAPTPSRPVLFATPEVPKELPPITEMAVTDFSAFITNPYLFYLQRVLRLEIVDDSARELDAASFGTLFHDVMEAFGRQEIQRRQELGDSVFCLLDEAALEAETERIQTLLTALLNQIFFARFGSQALPVVGIQREQLQERLMALAEKQAVQYRDGWRIRDVERSVTTWLREDGGRGDVLKFDENGQDLMLIHGKLDRIDFRTLSDGTQEWRIWDYKTFSDSPNKKHFGRQSVPEPLETSFWHDLQLPLYRHLIRAAQRTHEPQFADLAPIDANHLRVGYILVPKKTSHTEFLTADWDETVFQSADERIREIAQAVHDKQLPVTRDLALWDRGTEFEWIVDPN